MRIRFQADADLDGRIVRGLKRRSRDIDIRTAASADLAGLKDSDVLRISAEDDRILVSQDRRTMPGHFAPYVATGNSAGVILLREGVSLADAIDELIIDPVASNLLGSYAMGSVEFQFALLPNHGSLVSNLLLLGLLLSPSG